MRVCVPVAHVKMKLTISKTYKLVLLHFAACCACITVSNCIIKQHNLKQWIVTLAAVRLKPTILENLKHMSYLIKKKQEYKSFARELDWNTQLLRIEELQLEYFVEDNVASKLTRVVQQRSLYWVWLYAHLFLSLLLSFFDIESM